MDGRREIAASLHCVVNDAGARILDCGCATGHTAEEVMNVGHVFVTVGVNPEILKKNTKCRHF